MKTLSKIFTSPLVNIITAGILLGGFWMAAQNVIETFAVARMVALKNLRASPPDYLWQVNIQEAPVDANIIRSFTDYYEYLQRVFPGLRETDGLLGYCYHYLHDDTKARAFLETAIERYPDYFWNYYNLAAIDINQSRYDEASDLLQQALQYRPEGTMGKLLSSQEVYLPLLDLSTHGNFNLLADHLKQGYALAFLIVQVIHQTPDKEGLKAGLANLQPEVYAF